MFFFVLFSAALIFSKCWFLAWYTSHSVLLARCPWPQFAHLLFLWSSSLSFFLNYALVSEMRPPTLYLCITVYCWVGPALALATLYNLLHGPCFFGYFVECGVVVRDDDVQWTFGIFHFVNIATVIYKVILLVRFLDRGVVSLISRRMNFYYLSKFKLLSQLCKFFCFYFKFNLKNFFL